MDAELLSQTKNVCNAPNLVPDSRTQEQLHTFFVELIPNNPNTKKKADWTEVRKFSLMLGTQLGVIE